MPKIGDRQNKNSAFEVIIQWWDSKKSQVHCAVTPVPTYWGDVDIDNIDYSIYEGTEASLDFQIDDFDSAQKESETIRLKHAQGFDPIINLGINVNKMSIDFSGVSQWGGVTTQVISEEWNDSVNQFEFVIQYDVESENPAARSYRSSRKASDYRFEAIETMNTIMSDLYDNDMVYISDMQKLISQIESADKSWEKGDPDYPYIIKDLEKRLEDWKTYPIWSEGMSHFDFNNSEKRRATTFFDAIYDKLDVGQYWMNNR